MRLGTIVIQNLFFPGLKVRPKRAWSTALEALGQVSELEIPRDGGAISAIEIKPAIDPKTVVIFAHPLSKKAKFYPLSTGRAELYLKQGAAVVAFDFNGFGSSDRIDLFYWKDARAVIQAVHARYPKAKIVLHGMSFGAFHIIRAVPSLPAGSSVVLENVSRSLFDYWKRWFLTRNAVRALQVLRLKSITDMNVREVLETLPEKGLSLTLLACENDSMTPAQEMEDVFNYARTSAKTFVTIPKAKHLEALSIAPEKYAEALAGLTETR